MKNLIVETQSTAIFSSYDFLPRKNYLCCYNFDKNICYFVDCDENTIHVINLTNGTHSVKKLIAEKKKSKPIGIEYCSNNEEVYIGFDCGTVYELSGIDDEEFDGKEVADFPTGLLYMKISPDNELMAYVTKDLHLSLITFRYFECLNNTNLMSDEFGEKAFISVGWGKKETQFHGSIGKTAATATQNKVKKSDTDNNLPIITWNDSSELFAVSFIDLQVNARKFKVFNRKGVLQYTSELVDCLERTLAWKPSANLIASTRILPNKRTIAFFTKNGLLHREFTLPFNSKNIHIQELIWSRDSDVLGIWLNDADSDFTTVQLWSQNNYHWYLKQTIVYPKKNPVLYITWYPQHNKDLSILSSKSNTTYTFYWIVSHSYGKKESDKAVVSVINGDQVYITKFRYFIVPPPMCQQKLQFKQNVNAISFSPIDLENPKNNSNDFLVLLSNNKIILCKDSQKPEESDHLQHTYKTYNVDLKIKNADNCSLHLIQHFFWYKQDLILCSVSIGAKSCLYELRLLHIDALDEILIDAEFIHEMPDKIQHIFPSSDGKTAYIAVKNKIYTYNERDGLLKSERVIAKEELSRTIVKIESVDFGEKEVILALTQNNILYANGNRIINNVTSFFVHSETLLITTQQHTLISFDLNTNGFNQLCTQDLTIQPWENKFTIQDLNIRRVERGSTLVVVVPKTDRTILQMPRGNLETIQHRALSIGIIKPLLDANKYKEALNIMRKQQIDYNLFYDHDPQSFINNTEKFMNDFDVKNLTTFLTELNDQDVTQTIYKNSYNDRTKYEIENSQKIDMVCQMLRRIMDQNSNNYMEPIIISLVKKQDIAGIEKALKKLYELSKDEENEDDNNDAQQKLNRLNFLVNKKNLFDVALGTYDLNLAFFVAESTHNNSKEIQNFLNSFQEYEGDYMKYKIDMHLKRYTSALKNIAKIDEKFEECMKLICNQNLYAQGLKLFSDKTTNYMKIAYAYAEILESKGKYGEAGILYTKANELRKALVVYKKANSWRHAITTALMLKLSTQELNNLYQELVEQLKKEDKFNEAAIILSKYLKKFEDAVAMLCMGKEWFQAFTEASSMNRPDLIESHVRPSVLDHAEFLLGHLTRCKKEFSEHTTRLVSIRPGLVERRKLIDNIANPKELGEAGGDRCQEDYLDRSIADSTETRTSQASRSTTRSYRSSKNRRKHERKTYSIKKGSLYEDLGLIRTLHQLISQAYEQRDNVRSVVEMLLYVGSDEFAEKLQKSMEELLNDIRKRKHEIWPPVRENISIKENLAEEPGREKPNWIEPQLLFAPEEKPSNWKLDMFSLS